MADLCRQFLRLSRGLAGLSVIHDASVYFGVIRFSRCLAYAGRLCSLDRVGRWYR